MVYLQTRINNFFFNTTINTDNANFKQIREQNDIANQAAGVSVHPDRGTWEDAKSLASMLPGIGAIASGLEQATNTNNSALDRIMGGVSVGLSIAGSIGTAAAAEGRMCGLVSCFTAGTQVVVGEEMIESACGTEFVQVQSFDGCNMIFAGLCFGLVGLSVVLNRKRNNGRDNRKMSRHQQIDNAFAALDDEDFSLSEPVADVSVLITSTSASGKSSFLHPIFAAIIFSLAILCGYFALPTTKSIAVSTPPTQIEKRYVTKNIEDIQVGDEVYAYDIATGETVKRHVTSAFERTSDHLRYLTTRNKNGNQTFETTDSHPFWVVTDTPDLSRAARENVVDNDVLLHHENLGVTKNGYYVEAGDLRTGDLFISPNEELTTLEKTERIEYPNGIAVYNFEVEGEHNYFVIANLEDFKNGAEPVLVHNANKCGNKSKPTWNTSLQTSIREQLGGTGQIAGFERTPNSKGFTPSELLSKTPAQIDQMLKDKILTQKQYKQVRKLFEGRDLRHGN